MVKTNNCPVPNLEIYNFRCLRRQSCIEMGNGTWDMGHRECKQRRTGWRASSVKSQLICERVKCD